jgi:hypothetical protein
MQPFLVTISLTLIEVLGFAMPKYIRPWDFRLLESRLSTALIVGFHYGSVLLLCYDDSWLPLIRVS